MAALYITCVETSLMAFLVSARTLLSSPFLSSPHDNRTPAVGGDFWSILPGVTAHICLIIGMVV